MSWIRKVFMGRTPEPVAPPLPSPELKAAQQRHRELLTRADQAIKEAMDHADEMFEAKTNYRGPNRRKTAR